MDIIFCMQMILIHSIADAINNLLIKEVSTFVNKKNESVERVIGLFGKIDNEWVIIFAFYATEYSNGKVHLELVDSLQYYTAINRTLLYHVVLVAYSYTCACRGLTEIYFQSCPPGDHSYIFHNKPGSQKQLSKDRLLSWYHAFMKKGFEMGVFSGGSDFVGCGLDEIPDFLVDPEYRNDSLDKSSYFRIYLAKQPVIQETKLQNFDTIFYCPEDFKSTCIRNNLSFSTLDGAKRATRWILDNLAYRG